MPARPMAQSAAFSVVLLTYLYLKRYYGIDPSRVYRMAMMQLNTSPAVLEVSEPGPCGGGRWRRCGQGHRRNSQWWH